MCRIPHFPTPITPVPATIQTVIDRCDFLQNDNAPLPSIPDSHQTYAQHNIIAADRGLIHHEPPVHRIEYNLILDTISPLRALIGLFFPNHYRLRRKDMPAIIDFCRWVDYEFFCTIQSLFIKIRHRSCHLLIINDRNLLYWPQTQTQIRNHLS